MPYLSLAQAGGGWGVKAGLNYTTNGDYYDALNDIYQNAEANAGFNIGLFGKTKRSKYLRPELVYTNTNTKYGDDTFKMQKLDGTILAGLDFIKVFTVFIGPSFQYILDSKFESISIDDIENNYTVALDFGIGVNFKKIGIDLRYEGDFIENEASFITPGNFTESTIDTRSNQLILNVSIML